MSHDAPRPDFTKMKLVYALPGMENAPVRRDLPYGPADPEPLTFDLYAPADAAPGEKRPAVVFVSGYPDRGLQMVMGARFKDMGGYIGWAQLAAASGMVGVLATNRQPVADLAALLRHLREQGPALGIDPDRIGLWASSGNAPTALSRVMKDAETPIACAVLAYGLLMDLDGGTGVAQASATFHFANACAGKSIDDLRSDVPLFLVRAGRDQPGLNEVIERFVAAALARNLPVTVANHPAAPHAFDLVDDSDESREMMRRMLGFLRYYLRPQAESSRSI